MVLSLLQPSNICEHTHIEAVVVPDGKTVVAAVSAVQLANINPYPLFPTLVAGSVGAVDIFVL